MFKYKVDIDLSQMEKGLNDRFALGSRAQEFVSERIFTRGEKYMPKVTGTLINLSRAASTPLFKYGELFYPGPSAHYLWTGYLYVDPVTGKGAFFSEDFGFWSRPGVSKEATATPLIFNQEANPNAGPQWIPRMWNDEAPIVLDEIQRAIDSGVI